MFLTCRRRFKDGKAPSDFWVYARRDTVSPPGGNWLPELELHQHSRLQRAPSCSLLHPAMNWPAEAKPGAPIRRPLPRFEFEWQPSSLLRSAEVYKRFFAKARPEGLFRYRSKATDFSRSLNAIAVLISQGRYFEVCGTSPLLCFNTRLLRSSV